MLATNRWASRLRGAGLGHPFGITLMAVTLLLAGTMWWRIGLDTWVILGIALLGLLAYFASVFAVGLWQPEPSEPGLRQLYSIRRSMEATLADRKAARGSGPSELERVLFEAISHLDRQVAPALRQLLDRHQDLSRHLDRYERGELPTPEAGVLQRLRDIHARQQVAIKESVQQASNAAATLVALLQEGDESKVATQAQAWAAELLSLYDAIAKVLRNEADRSELDEVGADVDVKPSTSIGNSSPSSIDFSNNGHSSEDFPRLVEEALRQMNNPDALSRCGLIYWLPGTLATGSRHTDHRAPAQPGPLDQAQALREVLVSAIERLKPVGEYVRAGAPEALQHHILHEEYVLDKSTRYVMMRHGISESTFHRNRRAAISAVARQLETREELIAQGGKR